MVAEGLGRDYRSGMLLGGVQAVVEWLGVAG